MKLNISLIDKVAKNFHRWFLKTPIEYSPSLSNFLKVPVIFKCEYLQPTGSCNLRGAYATLSALSHSQRQQGISSYSIGSHGIAMAYAAHLLNIPCTIYAGKTMPLFHQQKIVEFGADLYLSPYKEEQTTLLWAKNLSDERLSYFIPSTNHPLLMAGNGGSLAMELIKDVPQLRHVILPIGEGEMVAGLTYFFKKKYPGIEVIACEHERAPLLSYALQKQSATSSSLPSYAHELFGSVSPLALEILHRQVDFVTQQPEEAILEGMRWMLRTHQCLIDPSSAVVIAACLSRKLPRLEGPTAVILSSKNIDPDLLKKLF